MHLVLDIGNTQYKLSVFQGNEMIFHKYYTSLSAEKVKPLLNEYEITQVIYSDTRGLSHEQITEILPSKLQVVELTWETPLPIKLNYKTPETLGKDRIAGAVGASGLFAGYPLLVIDIGTALTVDYISENGIFEGGIISPGPEIRFRALKDYTGKLPLVKPGENTDLFGKSTEEAIRNGVQNGVLFEINEYILRYTKQHNNLKVILTGGFAYLFDKKINYPIFAEPFLIPKGLNRILLYNE